jgi:transglutaminase-like putative cysteine protease
MPELRRALGWDDACLALLIAAGSTAFATAQLGASPWAGLLVLPLFAVSVPHVAHGIRRHLPRVMTGLLVTTLLFGLVWVLYPVLPQAAVRVVPRVLGFALGVLALAFLAGSSAWKPSAPALPAGLGLMTVAAYNPDASIVVPVAVGALAVFLYLAGPKAWPRAMRLGVFAATSLTLAFGIIRALPWAQPKVEAAAASVLNAGLETSSGLNLDSTTRLGDVQRLALSRRVALRVFTPRPQKLRARVFTRFDGARWSVENGAPARELVEAAPPPADRRGWLDALPGRSLSVPGAAVPDGAVPTQVLQLVPTDKALPAPVGVKLVRVSGAGVGIDRDGLLTPSRGSGVEIYGLLSDPLDHGGEATAEALAVPSETDPRLRELASRLADGAAPEERVRRTVDHLGRECRYSLEVGRFRTRQPIAEFLFEKKRGYCEYFASAAALLLRLEGVPTRFVTGYNVPGAEWARDHYVVRESDAHAWIEAWLPGRGFVEVDPTPADQYAEAHASERGWAAWEWAQARWSELMARLRAGDPVAAARWALGRLGVPLALLGLALGARRFLRRGGKRSGGPARTAPEDRLPRELARLLERLDRHWTRHGAPRPRSRAPLEHLEALPPEKTGGDASRRVVSALYAARFAGVRIPPEDVLVLVRLLDEGGIR